jgi:hypothetical protein
MGLLSKKTEDEKAAEQAQRESDRAQQARAAEEQRIRLEALFVRLRRALAGARPAPV